MIIRNQIKLLFLKYINFMNKEKNYLFEVTSEYRHTDIERHNACIVIV